MMYIIFVIIMAALRYSIEKNENGKTNLEGWYESFKEKEEIKKFHETHPEFHEYYY